jgi:hypothetical protein
MPQVSVSAGKPRIADETPKLTVLLPFASGGASYALRARSRRVPQMSPNRHQQPTVATSNNL